MEYLKIKVCYSLDEVGNIRIDLDSMRESYEEQLTELCLNPQDYIN